MRRSPTADVAVLNRVKLIVEALIPDYPRITAKLADFRANYPSGGTAGPGGKGGHTDLSDKVACGCPEHVACQHDGTLPVDAAEVDAATLGRALKLLLDGATLARSVQLANLGESAASANWCRGGCCPAGNMASPGKAGRCSACSRFWYESASNPVERVEREYVGRATAA